MTLKDDMHAAWESMRGADPQPAVLFLTQYQYDTYVLPDIEHSMELLNGLATSMGLRTPVEIRVVDVALQDNVM
jgi:hypothetical protein